MAHTGRSPPPQSGGESRLPPTGRDLERWGRIRTAFFSALECPESEWNGLLAGLCADEPDLHDEVLALLKSEAASATLSEVPAADLLLGEAAPFEPDAPVHLEPGARVGFYEVTGFISTGGMGEVYRGRHILLGREVALKIPRPDLADPSSGRRLVREARHASTLDHPNICRIHEVGEEGGRPFIAMELVNGQSLRESLRESPLSLEDALSCGIQVADALEHAHGLGIVHRDLKSSNVVVDTMGRSVVLDFGLSRRTYRSGVGRPADSTFTNAGILAGTLSHMAPEVLLGRETDARSDIWSFGVLLCELLAGELPFQGSTLFATSFGILHEPPRFMAGRVPLALRLVIERCLAKDPGGRYQSAAEVRNALDTIRRRRAWPLVGRLLLSARRRSLYGVGAAASLMVSLAFGGNLLREHYTSPLEIPFSTLALLPLENASGEPHADFYAAGLTEALTGQLGELADVRIIARGSAASVARSGARGSEAARQLGADAVIEGRLRQASDRIALDVWITEPTRGRVLWSDSYERSAEQVLVLQADLLMGLAAAIRLAVRPEARDRLAAVRAVDPAAYQAYLKGRWEWNKRSTESLHRAVAHFTEAIALDPTYAPAHAALADCYNQFGTMMVGVGSPREFRPLAAMSAIRALQIDPYSAEAHAALGYVRQYDWQWEESEREFLRAIELNPNYAPAHLWYANLLMSRKRLDEALEQVYAARDLDPFSLIVNTNVGWVLTASGRNDEAITHLTSTLQMDSTYAHARWRLAYALMSEGRTVEAYEQAYRVVELTGRSPPALGLLAHVSLELGKTDAARAILTELLERAITEYVPPPVFVGLYRGLGDMENAQMWTSRAFEDRDNWVVYLNTDPSSGPLQRDPRFQALVARSGLGR